MEAIVEPASEVSVPSSEEIFVEESRLSPVASTSNGPLKRKASRSPSPTPADLLRLSPSTLRRRTRCIRYGDLIILFTSRDKPTIPVTVTRGAHYSNAFGVFSHDSFAGRPFGSKIASQSTKGWLTLLRPTPELWTLSLPHRTQILYQPDMSFIMLKFGLAPGSKVAEAGTGSGSFTHALARVVSGFGPMGVKEGLAASGRMWQGEEGLGCSKKGAKGYQARPQKDPEEEEEQDASGTSTPAAKTPQTPPFKDFPTDARPILSEVNDKVTAAKAEASSTPDDEKDQSEGEPPSPAAGRVWSFEFHAARAAKARLEFELHGLQPTVSLSHRNVCLHGFPTSLDGKVEAIFLDLPAPWEVVPFLHSTLDPTITTMVCCFSPCIEQVLKTVKALNAMGWHEVETYESLVRTHESLKGGGSLEMPLRGVEEVKQKLRIQERKRERVSEKQRARARGKKEKDAAAENGAGENGVKSEEADDEENELEGDDEDGEEEDQETSGQDQSAQEGGDWQPVSHAELYASEASTKSRTDPQILPLPPGYGNKPQKLIRSNMYSRVHSTMRGHTSYLTFAKLLPRSSS